MAPEAPAQVGAQVATEEADDPVVPPLGHVDQLVAHQALVTHRPPSKRHHRAKGDGRRTRRDWAADPPPVIGMVLDGPPARGQSQAAAKTPAAEPLPGGEPHRVAREERIAPVATAMKVCT